MNNTVWDMDNLLIKLNSLEQQNHELIAEIKTLLKLSDDEFSMVKDILKTVISKCQADPIVKMRDNITKESIIAESLEKIQEKTEKEINTESNGTEVESNGTEIVSNGTEVESNGTEAESESNKEVVEASDNVTITVAKTLEEKAAEYVNSIENEDLRNKLTKLLEQFNNIKSTGLSYDAVMSSSGLTSEEKAIVDSFWKSSFYRLFAKPGCGSIENQRIYCELFKMFYAAGNTDLMFINMTYNVITILGKMQDDQVKLILASKYKKYKSTSCMDKLIKLHNEYSDIKTNLLKYENTKKLSDAEINDMCVRSLAYKTSNYKNCTSEDAVRSYLDRYKLQ